MFHVKDDFIQQIQSHLSLLLSVGPQGSGSYPVAAVENLHPCEEQNTISQGCCVVALRESACSSVHGNDPVR